MAILAPVAALETIERSLRHLFEFAFAARLGPTWLAHLVSANTVSDWQQKQETEEKRRGARGVAHVPTDLLQYAEFYHLVAIAEANWQDLAPALGKKQDTLALLRRFDQLRNTVAHSRALLPFEEDLLSGIAGEIRNRVTIYMSSQPTNEYWARIESVTDDFGNQVDGLQTVQTSNPHCTTAETLRVGDRVSFNCQATDPLGRPITWTIGFLPNDYSQPQVQPIEGEKVSFTWIVAEHHVSSQSSIQISMASDSPSHRWAEGWDGFAAFVYRVLPSN